MCLLPVQPKHLNPQWHVFHFHIDPAQYYESPQTIGGFSRPNTEIVWGAYIARPISTLRIFACLQFVVHSFDLMICL